MKHRVPAHPLHGDPALHFRPLAEEKALKDYRTRLKTFLTIAGSMWIPALILGLHYR